MIILALGCLPAAQSSSSVLLAASLYYALWMHQRMLYNRVQRSHNGLSWSVHACRVSTIS